MEEVWENNLTIVLNILYAKKEKYIYPVHVSKYNSNREKQVILWMITNVEEGHYLAVKILSTLIIRIISKNVIFIGSIIFIPLEKKLESHKKVYENKDFCIFIISFETLKY